MLPYPEIDEASQRQRRKDYVTLDGWDDVRYWCDSFDCSEGLLRAVASAGSTAEDVAAFLDEEIPLAYRGE